MVNLLEMKPYEDFAAKHGYRLNPNLDVARAIVKLLIEREKKYGERYCPCRKLFHDKVEDSKIICPCIFVHDDIKRTGKCHCGLFYRK